MDKINIIISPSQQTENPCKMGDSEANHARKISNLLADLLRKDERFNVYVIPVITGNVPYILNTVCSFSNSFVAQSTGLQKRISYHIAIHSDAFNGKAFGASAFYYQNGTKGEKMAKSIYSELEKFTPWTDRGCIPRPELAELRNTDAYAVLCELSFHDEITQAKFMHEKADGFAEALMSGIYKGCELSIPKKEIKTMYDPKLTVDEIIKRSTLNPEAWINFKETMKTLAEARGDIGDLEIAQYIDLLIKKIYDCDR